MVGVVQLEERVIGLLISVLVRMHNECKLFEIRLLLVLSDELESSYEDVHRHVNYLEDVVDFFCGVFSLESGSTHDSFHLCLDEQTDLLDSSVNVFDVLSISEDKLRSLLLFGHFNSALFKQHSLLFSGVLFVLYCLLLESFCSLNGFMFKAELAPDPSSVHSSKFFRLWGDYKLMLLVTDYLSLMYNSMIRNDLILLVLSVRNCLLVEVSALEAPSFNTHLVLSWEITDRLETSYANLEFMKISALESESRVAATADQDDIREEFSLLCLSNGSGLRENFVLRCLPKHFFLSRSLEPAKQAF